MEPNLDSPAPPMSGENLKLKELKPEEKVDKKEQEKKPAKKKKLILPLLIIITFVFLTGIIIGLFLRVKKKPKTASLPKKASPSPFVSMLPSPKPFTLDNKIKDFENNLKSLDLQKTNLNPPALDFNIRFKAEEK